MIRPGRPQRPAPGAAAAPGRLLFLVVALLLALALPGVARATTKWLAQAVAIESDSAAFPAESDAIGVPTALPDRWAASRPAYAGAVWYRLEFDAPADGELLGVLVERACARLDAFVNGERVHGGSGGSPRRCHRPHHFTIPAALLRPGRNTLDLRLEAPAVGHVASHQRAGALWPLQIGPANEIAALAERERFWQVTLPQLVAGTTLLLGGLILLLGALNPRERHLMYFGGLCLAWALLSSRLWLDFSALAPEVAERLIAATVPLAALCAVQFVLRYARWRHRMVDGALIAQCVVMPASLVLAGDARLFVVATVWYTLLGAELLLAMLWHLRLVARRQSPRRLARTAGLFALAALLVGVEFAAQQDWLGRTGRHLAPFAIPLVFALFGARLLTEHARALQAAEHGQRSLESRVREATAEMERNFKLMAEMRVEQVTQQERKRIAADLHDDLGAKLLTIVHTSADDRISTLAREALEEMRLSVRGLTGKPVRLSDALGDWRAELVARLSQAGVESQWRAPAEELPQMLAARAYVQTTRILREAISNVIKHSGASHCSVGFSVGDGDLQLVIQDNGRGIPMELDGKLDRGHGMASMKHRAKQLHGQCLVESGPGYGTVIRLTLPLERHLQPA